MKTQHMTCDMIADAFNGATDRGYWRANVGGTLSHPCVMITSRSAMVSIIYRPDTGRFSVRFSRTACPFGDYLYSAHKGLAQVLQAFKAVGMDFACPFGNEARLRIEYDPETKETSVHLAGIGDDWPEAEPMSFKVHENYFEKSTNMA